jgi:membrane-bound ClpP family serine protease
MNSHSQSLRGRSLAAIVLMSIGVIALLINGVTQGWTTLGVVATACLLVAIVAMAIQARNVGATG